MKKLEFLQTIPNEGSINNLFLSTGKKWISTEAKNLSITESGKKRRLMNNIVKSIQSAKKMICLQSFLIQETEIIRAIAEAYNTRNVRVFITDAAETRLGKSAYEEDDSFAADDYKNMLQTIFKNQFVHRQANNFHAKFILIDPNTQNADGYIFTGNFNEKPFTENPELGLKLSRLQITELFKVFVYHFWEHTTDEQALGPDFEKVQASNQFQFPELKHILVTTPAPEKSNLKNSLLQSVEKAQSKIAFSTFGFDSNNALSKAILEKLESGITVTIFTRPREKNFKNNLDKFAKAGAKIYCHPLIHAKSLLVDDKTGFIFSANFENRGLETGYEVGVRLNNEQINDLRKIYENWKETFPLEYKYEQKIIELSEYSTFENSTLINKSIPQTKQEQKKTNITKVEDLRCLLLNRNKNGKDVVRNFQIQHSVTFNPLSNYKKEEELSEEVCAVKTKKGKRAILLNLDNINGNKIEKLLEILDEDYVGLNIFAHNE